MKTKANPQTHCIPFAEAVKRMECLNQTGLLVKYFRVQVVSPHGGKLTLTFDPAKLAKEKEAK